jgi:hypothetical protein
VIAAWVPAALPPLRLRAAGEAEEGVTADRAVGKARALALLLGLEQDGKRRRGLARRPLPGAPRGAADASKSWAQRFSARGTPARSPAREVQLLEIPHRGLEMPTALRLPEGALQLPRPPRIAVGGGEQRVIDAERRAVADAGDNSWRPMRSPSPA